MTATGWRRHTQHGLRAEIGGVHGVVGLPTLADGGVAEDVEAAALPCWEQRLQGTGQWMAAHHPLVVEQMQKIH